MKLSKVFYCGIFFASLTLTSYAQISSLPNGFPTTDAGTGFFPFPLSSDTVEEGIIPGNPPDNSQNRPDLSVGVPIFYTVSPEPPTAAYGVDCCVNDNPSGDKEWELYRIASTAPDDYETTIANNGPFHTIDSRLILGVEIDADLQVTKTVTDSTPDEGQTVTYTVTVRNLGPGATYDPVTGFWDASTSGTTITNTASVSSLDQTDPNVATASVDVFLVLTKQIRRT